MVFIATIDETLFRVTFLILERNVNTPPIKLPIVEQTVLCVTPEESNTIFGIPNPIPKVYWASSPKEINNQRRYITASFGAPCGLANMIWRFASLYGIGRNLGREVYWDGRNPDQMARMPELALVFPLMHEKLHIKSYKFFHQYRDEIRLLFQCGPTAMQTVDVVSNVIFGNYKGKTHLLCAHIRRGDFLPNLMLESNKEFVLPAIQYALNYLQEQGHKNISLFFIGKDHPFINDLDLSNLSFSKIYKPVNLSRGDDMCLAIHRCDSMIMTASGSTFGWWISYLMPDNATIFYNSQITDYANNTKDIHDYDIFLNEWIKLTVNNGTAHREKWWWYQRHNWSIEQADAS